MMTLRNYLEQWHAQKWDFHARKGTEWWRCRYYNGRTLLRCTRFSYMPKLDCWVCTLHRSKAGMPSPKEEWLKSLGFEKIPDNVLDSEL